jgi:hypothetical protein
VEEEQKKEETPEPQSKLHIEESKIVKEKHERSLRRMQITTANKSKIVKEKHERSLRRMQITTNDVQTTTNNMQTTTNNMQITCKLLQISCKIVKEKHERSLRRMPITTNNVQTTTNNMQITANKLQNQVIQYILSSCSGTYLNLLTHLQKKDTVHLHVLESITQTVVIGSATNATKEAVTRTILENLTCSRGNYNQCTACNSGSYLYRNTGGEYINPCPNGFWGDTSTNTCQPCYSSGSGAYYTCATCSAGGRSSNCE